MTRYYCRRCHRPMKHATETGLGPKCYAKAGKTIPAHDLFGLDLDRAQAAASAIVALRIQSLADDARVAIRRAAEAARRRRMEALA